MLTHFDSFSGFGGFALAARWTGAIQTVAFCEIEPYCCKVLNKNFPGIPILGDIRKLGNADLEPFRPIDIFTGGFPCQPYSVAGRLRGDEDDRALWREMLRVIEILQPTWIVGENVANFVNMALDPMLIDLEGKGYEAIPFVIPAASVGAWHERYRCFTIAHATGKRCDNRRNPKRKHSLYSKGEYGSQVVKQRRGFRSISGASRSDVPYTQCDGLEKSRNARIQTGAANSVTNPSWWAVEPELGRVANGIPNRVERIKGLGNAVVPQQVYPILQGIVQVVAAPPA